MEFRELSDLCISVLKDFRVIFAAVLTIIFISIGNYVVSYRKRPPRPARLKKAAAQPAQKQEQPEEKEEQQSS
ncbi:MAG: hypothetical protein J6K96_00495 [Treponema sp.]|nr:hypothetical protein [Treponema sp.]